MLLANLTPEDRDMSTLSLRSALGREPGFIRTDDGVALFYRDWGRGEPVVFLASWSLPSESWTYQMLGLTEQGFRCVAYDRRGHGRSSDPGTGYDFDRLADDLAAVLEALDLSGVTLVGHSMAPGECIRYLTRHGGARVARLVMIGTLTPALKRTPDNPGGAEPAYFEQFRRDCLMRDFPRWIDENLRPFVTPDTSAGMMGWIKEMALSASPKALLELNRSIGEADFAAELAAVTVPTLVVHGDRDVTCPLDSTGRRTAALMPDATLEVYEGAPHGLMFTHIDRLNADIAGFVRGDA
jgi:pimeloyl-ACP methyl ester carboxylesterase